MTAFLAILRKEFTHIRRDGRSLLASLALPLLLLVLFGYAIRIDVKSVPLGVMDEDRSAGSRALVAALCADGAVQAVETLESERDLDDALDRGRIRMGLVIPRGYAAGLAAGQDVPVQLVVDGTDASYAGQALARVGSSVRTDALREITRTLRLAGGPRELPGLWARPRVLFNESLNGTWFIIPGLIAIIVSMLAAMVTSQCVAREYEQGTIEQILVSPVRGASLMLGKLVPYVCLGLVQVATVTVASRFLFGVPIRGSLGLLAICTLLYLFGSMALGLMLSAVLKSQQVAMQVAFVATMLPSLLLSGFVFPITNMPLPLQWISYIVPARYFVRIARGLFLKGVGVQALLPEIQAMVIYAAVLVILAISRFRRSLA